MSKAVRRTVRVKWVRSGIGFSWQQKEMIGSLGLRRLNQVVERPDTPQIRGLVARIPHLVEIVGESPQPAWATVPEYTVHPAEAGQVPVAPLPSGKAMEEVPANSIPSEVEQPVTQPLREKAQEKPVEEAPRPAEGARTKKLGKPGAARKSKATRGEETKRSKAAGAKVSKPPKKRKK